MAWRDARLLIACLFGSVSQVVQCDPYAERRGLGAWWQTHTLSRPPHRKQSSHLRFLKWQTKILLCLIIITLGGITWREGSLFFCLCSGKCCHCGVTWCDKLPGTVPKHSWLMLHAAVQSVFVHQTVTGVWNIVCTSLVFADACMVDSECVFALFAVQISRHLQGNCRCGLPVCPIWTENSQRAQTARLLYSLFYMWGRCSVDKDNIHVCHTLKRSEPRAVLNLAGRGESALWLM